jgi:hypothetical protein
VVGGVRLSEGDFFIRWVLLGSTWIWVVLLGFPLWKRLSGPGPGTGPGPIPPAGLGAGAVAVVVNLLAAGGIGISTVALGLWMQIALGLNLRDDRGCGRLRGAGGRLAAFTLAAVWAALVGTFWAAITPFWESEAALAAAEGALRRRPPDYARAEECFNRALEADQYNPRPWLGLANLETAIWRARGSRSEDLRWRKIPILLLKAASPPRSPEAWSLHSYRADMARELLAALGDKLTPAEILQLRGNAVESARTASRLYPSNATLHARLAEASAEIGMMADAAGEAREALRLDRLTPHADRKLAAPSRRRLEAQLPGWSK